MDKKTFETLAAVGKLDEVVLYQVGGGFELWSHSEGYKGAEDFKTALGERRVWASADTALGFIRGMGYTGKVTVDTPAFAQKPPVFEPAELQKLGT